MRLFKLIFLLIFPVLLHAQISAVDGGKGGANNNVTDIVIAFKMHVDVGFTDWAEGVLQKYSGPMLEKTLDNIDKTASLPKNEQFVWTIPAWPLQYMLDNSSPQNKIRLEKAIKAKRIIPHAMPFTMETESSDMENLTRGLSFADNINRRYGLNPARDAKFTDVPEHSWVIPTLLKNAGVDILHIGCNAGSASPDVPTLFWWQGPDGSKLLTFYWAQYYGSGILPPKDWPHKTWLAMIHTHENTGAPDPKEVAALLKEAKEKMPNARIHIGRISDFYDLLMKEDPKLPVIKGDMPDTWIHGFMSMPTEVKTNKIFQRETYVTEQLNAQMNIWKNKNVSVDKYVNKAVENMLLFDEHTFGGAISHGHQMYWKNDDEFKINRAEDNYYFLEKSWEEKAAYTRTAEKTMWPLKRHLLFELVKSVKDKSKHVTVYNPLPWKRTGRVSLFQSFWEDMTPAPRVAALKDLETGKIIPVYQCNNLLSFDATDIPAGGYKTFTVVEKQDELLQTLSADPQNNVLENRYFKLIINPSTGTLQSVFDKQNNRELVDSKSKYAFGEYVYEQLGQEQIEAYNKNYVKPGQEGWAAPTNTRPMSQIPNKHHLRFTGKCYRIDWLNNNKSMIRATAMCQLNDSNAQRYLVNYTLYENQPYIEVTVGLDGKKPVPNPEAGWMAFPFALEKPEYRLLRAGGIVDPNKDLVPKANHDFYFLNTAMAMYDNAGGIGLNCPYTPGVSIDKPGIGVYSKTRMLSSGTVFSNLYNNLWGCNFTEWIEGSFSAKFYIWSYKNYDAESSLITPAEETRTPMSGAFYVPSGGSFVYNYETSGELPNMQEGLSLDKKGIIITSFNKKGNEAVIRFWEEAGRSGKCTVTLSGNASFKKAYLCNLRGEHLDEKGITIANNSFTFEIGANQPRTFILK